MMRLQAPPLVRPVAPQISERLRFELAFALLFAFALPALLAALVFSEQPFATTQAQFSLAASMAAALGAIVIRRRLAPFPGIRRAENELPALIACYGLAIGFTVLFRIDYSRVILFSGFACCLGGLLVLLSRYQGVMAGHFWLVPLGRASRLRSIAEADWRALEAPQVPADPRRGIVADLHADLPDAWERMLADAVLAGIPVFHFKQLEEALTGRVDIEHMAENTLGSLAPDQLYLKVKRLLDVAAAVILLPILALPLALVALAIRLDSPGPVLFRQERVGLRGRVFRVIKFRTMRVGQDRRNERAAAMTQDADPRITKLGAFLRRTRIDELPQIVNVLRGEMSWIGPRPEALALSQWYAGCLPFYAYRHILRPGISGWAQVNQGHVADLRSVHDKLRYDFFYIKNFSVWLDLLIVARTVRVMLSGHGAK